MASHMACIGFPTTDAKELEEITLRLANAGDVTTRQDGGRMITWRDKSGAGLVFNLNDDNEIRCVTPTFWGASRQQVMARDITEDVDCSFCDRLKVDVVDRKGHMFYPMAVQLDDMGLVRNQLPFNKRIVMSMTGFAEGVEIWPSEKAFHAEQQGEEAKLAAESVIPAGLFSPQGEENKAAAARIMMTGRVARSEVKVNGATGERFCHAFVRSYGALYDMVASAQDLPGELVPGNIVQGMFWMIGRIVEGLKGKARWTWVGKIFPGKS